MLPVTDALAWSGRRGGGDGTRYPLFDLSGRLCRSSNSRVPGPASPRRPARRAIGPCPRRTGSRGDSAVCAGAGGGRRREALAGALSYALGAGKDATLRDAMRFSAGRHALAREYARDFEITRELARPALLSSLSRADSVRGALVQAYLEVLSEVPDLDVAGRAGRQEAEEVSRMAHGVLKAGGVHLPGGAWKG